MEYHSPVSLQDAVDLLNDGDAKIVAGATDFFPGLERGRAPERLLDVSRVSEMRGISVSEAGWRIGGATTWSEILEFPFPPAFAGLKAAAREVGSVQIQNAGTVGGNLCNASPAADGVPPLLTLEAVVETVSASGSRLVPLEEFIVGVRSVNLEPDEICAAIHVPGRIRDGRGSFLKLGARRYLVISISMVAVLVHVAPNGAVSEARISVGACSPVAKRMPELEAAVVGLSAEELESDFPSDPKLLDPLAPLDDIRASAVHRMQATTELCRRAVIEAVNLADGNSA